MLTTPLLKVNFGNGFGNGLPRKSQEKLGLIGGIPVKSGLFSHFHAGDRGSNPLGDATFIKTPHEYVLYSCGVFFRNRSQSTINSGDASEKLLSCRHRHSGEGRNPENVYYYWTPTFIEMTIPLQPSAPLSVQPRQPVNPKQVCLTLPLCIRRPPWQCGLLPGRYRRIPATIFPHN